jgi:hypothetical protein
MSVDATVRTAFSKLQRQSVEDNVEAYAPASAIFALSGNDTLTGSRCRMCAGDCMRNSD